MLMYINNKKIYKIPWHEKNYNILLQKKIKKAYFRIYKKNLYIIKKNKSNISKINKFNSSNFITFKFRKEKIVKNPVIDQNMDGYLLKSIKSYILGFKYCKLIIDMGKKKKIDIQLKQIKSSINFIIYFNINILKKILIKYFNEY